MQTDFPSAVDQGYDFDFQNDILILNVGLLRTGGRSGTSTSPESCHRAGRYGDFLPLKDGRLLVVRRKNGRPGSHTEITCSGEGTDIDIQRVSNECGDLHSRQTIGRRNIGQLCHGGGRLHQRSVGRDQTSSPSHRINARLGFSGKSLQDIDRERVSVIHEQLPNHRREINLHWAFVQFCQNGFHLGLGFRLPNHQNRIRPIIRNDTRLPHNNRIGSRLLSRFA